MAVTTAGFAGPTVRADVLVRVEDAAETSLEVESTVASMYGRAIEAQARATLATFGSPSVSLRLDDGGALPFVIEARLEAALSRHLGRPLPPLPESPVPERERTRLRRTRLYVPGNSPKLIANCGLYGADVVILDLEDSVPEGEKDAARALVRRALASVDFGGSERTVRINSGERGLDDVRTLAAVEPDAFVVPKVEDPALVGELDRLLESLRSGAFLIAILESALGVQRAFEIASASQRLVAMTLGVEDYLADVGASGRHASVWANGAVLNACRAAGVVPLAPVCSTIDADAAERQAREMAGLGFEGIGCIHPLQIVPAHRGAAPSEEQAARAARVVEAFEEAQRSGSGVVAVDGKMVDAPVYARAKRLLQIAGREGYPW